MHKHVGRDHTLAYHFEIAQFDADSRTVLIRYQETPWLSEPETTVVMSMEEFLSGLMEGRFEILRVDCPALP